MSLLTGAYVERIRFAAVLLISALWLLIVYAPVAHWVWGGGWLAKMGVMDFAGGIVVHVTAGVSAGPGIASVIITPTVREQVGGAYPGAWKKTTADAHFEDHT